MNPPDNTPRDPNGLVIDGTICPKCDGYVPGHATGAGDICQCEPITTQRTDNTPRTCPDCGGTRWVEPTLDESAGNEGEVVPCPTCQIVPSPDAARECAERCAAAAVITKYAKEIVASKIAPIIAETLAGVTRERDDALTAEARAEKAWDTADKERTKLLASVTRLRGVLERVNTDATSNPSSQRIRASTLLDVQSALADSGPDPVAELRTRAEKAEALVASYDRQDELIGTEFEGVDEVTELDKRDESRLPEKYAGATPGPWGIEQTPGTNWIGPMRKSGDGKVSTLVAHTDREGLKPDALRLNDANARLIADAPQLAADNEALRKEVEHSHGAVKEWAKKCDEHIEVLVRLRREMRTLREAGNAVSQSFCRNDEKQRLKAVDKLQDALFSYQSNYESNFNNKT